MAGQTQLSARLGMDNAIFKHDIPSKHKRSSFPYGRKRDFCLDPGMIVPIDLWETLPGDYFEVDLQYILKSFPLKVPPFTTYKVRTHWYYCKKVDLWKGALTYMVKGRSHSISLSVPKITLRNDFYENIRFDSPFSLASFFGFQPGCVAPDDSLENSCDPCIGDPRVLSSVKDFYGGVTALPFFMYQKIYRFGYVKPNLLQDNKIWFPDDMSDGWRISYSKSNLHSDHDIDSEQSIDVKNLFTPTDSVPLSLAGAYGSFYGVPSVTDEAVNILQLRYAMFEDDRFTTALPWSTRGTPPKVNVDSNITVDLSGMSITTTINNSNVYAGDHQDVTVEGGTYDSENSQFESAQVNYDGTSDQQFASGQALKLDSVATSSVSGSAPGIATSLGFDINDLRAKIALTVWQERNVTTQGYYNEMIYAHFGENPDSQDYEPRYLGGTSDIISFSEVIQHDNANDDNTPQGHAAGLGEARSGGHVFSYRCKDYGFIMGVMIIQPETVYNSKIEKMWLREIQEDEYFPEFESLGLTEILKGEIYPSGTSSDKELFGYQERDTEYKTRDNQAIGFFALPHLVDNLMSAYSQCREFSSQPSLSQQFVTMSPNNIRKDCLAVPSMPFFRCSLATSIHAVRPMSYSNHPNTFGF